MGDRTRGAFTASQVYAGRKNRLSIEIYGSKAGVAWDQERPDELWIGHRNTPNQIIVKDPVLAADPARAPMRICPAATAKATTTPSSRCSAASINRWKIRPPSPNIRSSRMGCASCRFSKPSWPATTAAPGSTCPPCTRPLRKRTHNTASPRCARPGGGGVCRIWGGGFGYMIVSMSERTLAIWAGTRKGAFVFPFERSNRVERGRPVLQGPGSLPHRAGPSRARPSLCGREQPLVRRAHLRQHRWRQILEPLRGGAGSEVPAGNVAEAHLAHRAGRRRRTGRGVRGRRGRACCSAARIGAARGPRCLRSRPTPLANAGSPGPAASACTPSSVSAGDACWRGYLRRGRLPYR